MKPKKEIAIFHQFMDNIGGAEILTLYLARELNAVIYTTNIDRDKIKKMGFSNVEICSIGKVPKRAPFRQQISLLKFRRLKLGKSYKQYIISGDWAIGAAVNHKPNLWYVHSPLHELWAFRKYIRKEMITWWKRPLYDAWVFLNRNLTKRYVSNIQKIISNSKNTSNRVKKYYKRDSLVVNPPVDVSQYSWSSPKDYWLSVNRLFNHKNIDLQLKAFQKLPDEKLIIVGSYEKGADHFDTYVKRLLEIKPDNVTILHWVDSKELQKLYSECKGLITTADREDFGMNAIEAMASGKQVIAPNSHGYAESVIDGKTGHLIKPLNLKELFLTIRKSSEELKKNPKIHVKDCQNRAEVYDLSKFISQIKENI